jgi:hypothetical protein
LQGNSLQLHSCISHLNISSRSPVDLTAFCYFLSCFNSFFDVNLLHFFLMCTNQVYTFCDLEIGSINLSHSLSPSWFTPPNEHNLVCVWILNTQTRDLIESNWKVIVVRSHDTLARTMRVMWNKWGKRGVLDRRKCNLHTYRWNEINYFIACDRWKMFLVMSK